MTNLPMMENHPSSSSRLAAKAITGVPKAKPARMVAGTAKKLRDEGAAPKTTRKAQKTVTVKVTRNRNARITPLTIWEALTTVAFMAKNSRPHLNPPMTGNEVSWNAEVMAAEARSAGPTKVR